MMTAPSQFERFADSALLKLASSAAALIICPALLWTCTRLFDRLDAMEKILSAMQTERATIELRVKSLEVVPAEVKAQGDEIIVLKIRLEQLEHDLNAGRK